MNRFETQIELLNQYSEELIDRMHLLIKTDQIVVSGNCVTILNRFQFISDGQSAMPRMKLIGCIEGPVEFKIFELVCKNYLEIASIISNYTVIYLHLKGFESKMLRVEDANDQALIAANQLIQLQKTDTLKGYKHLIVETEENIIELECYHYGTDRKPFANNRYIITNKATGSQNTKHNYFVDKTIYVEEFIYQIANRLATKLKLDKI